MAEALGWPDAELGWSDILGLATSPGGWAAEGHPDWGPFKLGKTNPNYSTSGLHALLGSYYAATGLTSDLTIRDIRSPEARAFVEGVESSVYHYGDISLTFLANLQAADDRGEGLTYISAVAIEEKSVWDYNQGNPSGDPATLGDHAKPSEPLVAIYPKEGTLVSDHPYVELTWMNDETKRAADSFLTFLRADAQQDTFREFAFRGYEGEPGPLTTQANGLLPDQPAKVLGPPAPEVLDAALRSWTGLRKRARVILLIDTSGSMNENAAQGRSKIDLVREAAARALGSFAPDDDVALWTFSNEQCTERVPLGPLAGNRDAIQGAIGALFADGDTPLYECVREAVDRMRGEDATRINGVVVLSDGENAVGAGGDDCLDCLVDDLDQPELNVRVFTIAYGGDAELDTLQQISAASRAAAYDSTDPELIDKVFASVISNF
jgi:Ca-activated chloride channel homolog